MGRGALQLAMCAVAVLLWACPADPGRSDGGRSELGEAGPGDASLGDRGDRAPSDDVRGPDGPPAPSNMGEGCIASGPCLPGSPDCLVIDKKSRRGICTRTWL